MHYCQNDQERLIQYSILSDVDPNSCNTGHDKRELRQYCTALGMVLLHRFRQ